jgi:hypothetical protein
LAFSSAGNSDGNIIVQKKLKINPIFCSILGLINYISPQTSGAVNLKENLWNFNITVRMSRSELLYYILQGNQWGDRITEWIDVGNLVIKAHYGGIDNEADIS